MSDRAFPLTLYAIVLPSPRVLSESHITNVVMSVIHQEAVPKY